MPGKIYIPNEVKESIIEHLNHAIEDATAAYENASEEEDTLVGQLGFSLKCKMKNIEVKENRQREQLPGIWQWSLKYTKFRGRGPKATENIIGADGIFEFGVKYGQSYHKKSVLFQAKNNLSSDNHLFFQSLKLSTWREAAFVINFIPGEIEAFHIDDVIMSQGIREKISNKFSLFSFLSEIFIECQIGDLDLKYDAKAHRLVWLSQQGEKVNIKFYVKNRFSIEVVPPTNENTDYGREISISEIYDHRMKFSPDDLFSLKGEYSHKELKKARNKYALIYHPDRTNQLDDLSMQLNTRRMQEGNFAYAELLKKKKK